MSWLYQGKNTQTQEPVWLKIPFDNALTNPIYAASIRTERKLFIHLQHSNLLKLKDNLGDVLITEAPEAESFAEYIHRKSPFTQIDILPYFQQLCDLLSYLHHQGVVHHHLRPESMVISKHRHLRLIDLGLAFWADLGDPLSETQLCPQGDKRYMSPEQSEGKRGDPRSDIYALGVLLYLMLTGKTPSESEEILPVSVRSVISKAMSPNPDQRYQWVEDFWEDLQNKVATLEIYV
jgi:serine/threonine-protein kinase